MITIKEIIQETIDKKKAIIITLNEFNVVDDQVVHKLPYIPPQINTIKKCYIVMDEMIIGWCEIISVVNNIIYLDKEINSTRKIPFKHFSGYRFFDENLINVL